MSVDDRTVFAATAAQESATQAADPRVRSATREWMNATQPYHYSYHFTWLGLPIIQYPPDIVALQELVWQVRPDLIIETGVARGGSLILSASLLALLDLTESTAVESMLDSNSPGRRVVGIDIDIRPHNRSAIESHPLANRITLIEGSSTDQDVVQTVTGVAQQHQRVMVLLDSNHTHAHVLAELEAYSPLVTEGSYCVVFDTVIEDMPAELFPDRPWGPDDNPRTAVREFLGRNDGWVVDESIDARLLISVARGGYLMRARGADREG